jgi:uncharacterized protein (UPF0335 family)
MTDAHGVARDQLRAFIERIERLEEEKKTIADDIKDVYAEAKGMGFIPAMMKKVIALRKKDEQERMEEEAILDTYLHALGMIQADLFEEPHHPKTGELIDPKLAQTVVTGMQTETGRKALIAAVDIMIAREEAEEETHQRPSTNDEPSPEVGPQAEISPAGTGSGTLADREGRFEGEAASADLPTYSKTDAAISRPGIASLGRPEIENRSDKEAPEAGASGGMQDEIAIHPADPIDPSEDREEGHSLDGSADANAGGDHVDAQPNAATLNNRLDGKPVQSAHEVTFETVPRRPMKSLSYAHCFPELTKTEYQCLAGDIALNGVLEPIIRMGDIIVDGWNRYNAARSLGIEYPVREYRGDDVLLDVIRWQRSSRDWTPQQESKIAAALAKAVPHRSKDIWAAFHLAPASGGEVVAA